MRAILGELALRARLVLQDRQLDEVWPEVLDKVGPDGALKELLVNWALADPRPLVLLIDEIDTLVGDTLISVLRQLRSGYDLHPEGFPHSVVLCGVRDVRDYRIHSSAANAVVTGGSAFNIKARSLRLGDFSRDEMQALLAQHTRETGQAFTEDARETIWTRTQGQPWLVNALADETCFRHESGRDRGRPITAEAIRDAQEQLIIRHETHLDQLADKLKEERVRRVVEPLLSGGEHRRFTDRDLEYARDLGLVAMEAPIRIANPLYAEVVPRELTWVVQEELTLETAWYVAADGGLLVDKLLAALQAFFLRALRALGGPVQLPGSRAAASPAGIPAARRERRRAHRTGIRPRPGPHRPADRVAARRAGAPVRGRMQDPAPKSGAHHQPGAGTDGGLPGSLRRGGGPPGHLRPC